MLPRVVDVRIKQQWRRKEERTKKKRLFFGRGGLLKLLKFFLGEGSVRMQINDIVRTPLGIRAVVVGVK